MFTYPTNVEMNTLEPELVQADITGRAGFEIMPVRNVNAAKVRWTQQDNYTGLQALRGLDGRPTHVGRVGQKTYEYEPGYFGEYVDITETELTTRAGSSSTNQPIDVTDLVVAADNQLIQRENDRMESSIWTLIMTGTISITLRGEDGIMIGYSDTYPIQSFTASVAWSVLATATPLRNFQSVQLLGAPAGKSVDFGGGATAWMNSVTAQNMVNNLNANDLNGKRINGGSTVNSLKEVNDIFIGQGLPKVRVYDAGYINEPGGAFRKFIPDNKVAVVGRRSSGTKIGEYLRTRNANNPNFNPGPYRYIIDRINATNAEKRTPPNIEVHRGHNGGPTILFPSAIVIMNV